MPVLRFQPFKQYVHQTIGRFTSHFRGLIASSTFKRFALALLFSVALHGLLVHQVLLAAFKQAALLNDGMHTELIQAELVNTKPEVTTVLPKPLIPPKPIAQPTPVIDEPLPEPVAAVPEPAATEVASLSTSDATGVDANAEFSLAAEDGQTETTIQNNDPVIEGLPPLPANQEMLIGEPNFSKAYRTVETLFDVRTDINASPTQSAAGSASIVFKLDDDGIHYQIESLIEPKGFAALFIADLTQTSRGLVSTNGLQPQQYDYAFGNKADKTYRASFDWINGLLKLQSSKGVKQVPLKVGAQDLLSFMYQFMYAAPSADLQVMMTNGKKLASYDYRFAGEEVIQTKMGELNTIHLARTKATEDEKTELWLALDYRYAPVKIRKIEKNGKVYELLATQIKTEETQINN